MSPEEILTINEFHFHALNDRLDEFEFDGSDLRHVRQTLSEEEQSCITVGTSAEMIALIMIGRKINEDS